MKGVKEFFRGYRWLIAAFVLFLVIISLIHEDAFYKEIGGEISDPNWLAGSALSFFVFTVLVGVIVRANRVNVDRPFEGWIAEEIYNGNRIEWSLSVRDARSFDESTFELWKFVKSLVSNHPLNLETTIDKATESDEPWLIVRKEKKSILINIDKAIEQKQVKPRSSPPEKGWIVKIRYRRKSVQVDLTPQEASGLQKSKWELWKLATFLLSTYDLKLLKSFADHQQLSDQWLNVEARHKIICIDIDKAIDQGHVGPR